MGYFRTSRSRFCVQNWLTGWRRCSTLTWSSCAVQSVSLYTSINARWQIYIGEPVERLFLNNIEFWLVNKWLPPLTFLLSWIIKIYFTYRPINSNTLNFAGKNLKVRQPENYNWDPKWLLGHLINIYLHLDSPTLDAALANDQRSFSLDSFKVT